MALCLGNSYHGKDSLIIEIVREETSEKTSKPYHLGIGRNFFYNIKKPLQNPASALGGSFCRKRRGEVASPTIRAGTLAAVAPPRPYNSIRMTSTQCQETFSELSQNV